MFLFFSFEKTREKQNQIIELTINIHFGFFNDYRNIKYSFVICFWLCRSYWWREWFSQETIQYGVKASKCQTQIRFWRLIWINIEWVIFCDSLFRDDEMKSNEKKNKRDKETEKVKLKIHSRSFYSERMKHIYTICVVRWKTFLSLPVSLSKRQGSMK